MARRLLSLSVTLRPDQVAIIEDLAHTLRVSSSEVMRDLIDAGIRARREQAEGRRTA